ncbi:MAG: chemotaxis-specific protein-glutamate methyltransferase CheB [Thermodesulfobacteriota bacterium]|nr:chemotaxis-specific protein-glutamate methyltransferase CheB [Thermodesulfobacteriota bacterium]
MKSLQVLIIEDSQVMQKLLSDALSAEPDIGILGIASDPIEARDIILKRKPDVITLDIEMPRIDGITFLKRLMNYDQIPVVMISSYTKSNSIQTIRAMEAGAFDFVTKPADSKGWDRDLWNEIITKVKAAAGSRIQRYFPVCHPSKSFKFEEVEHPKLIAIGASTGGIRVIEKILSGINFTTKGILVMIHLPHRYAASFTQRLNDKLPIVVKDASDMNEVEPGVVLVAPGGGKDMRVIRDGAGYMVRLDNESGLSGRALPIDVLFRSVAENAGKESIGVILTGMGNDGAEGLAAMKKSGAYTIAQNEASCMVFGMPKSAIKLNAVNRVVSPERIANVIRVRSA